MAFTGQTMHFVKTDEVEITHHVAAHEVEWFKFTVNRNEHDIGIHIGQMTKAQHKQLGAAFIGLGTSIIENIDSSGHILDSGVFEVTIDKHANG